MRAGGPGDAGGSSRVVTVTSCERLRESPPTEPRGNPGSGPRSSLARGRSRQSWADAELEIEQHGDEIELEIEFKWTPPPGNDDGADMG